MQGLIGADRHAARHLPEGSPATIFANACAVTTRWASAARCAQRRLLFGIVQGGYVELRRAHAAFAELLFKGCPWRFQRGRADKNRCTVAPALDEERPRLMGVRPRDRCHRGGADMPEAPTQRGTAWRSASGRRHQTGAL
jgi:hypothetical protein